MRLNHTHDVTRKSWLASADKPSCDFPIQNLPFAVFRRAGSGEAFRGGVAIGDQVVDLGELSRTTLLNGLAAQATAACAQPTLNELFAMGPAAWRALRHDLFALLESAAPASVTDVLRDCLVLPTNRNRWSIWSRGRSAPMAHSTSSSKSGSRPHSIVRAAMAPNG